MLKFRTALVESTHHREQARLCAEDVDTTSESDTGTPRSPKLPQKALGNTISKLFLSKHFSCDAEKRNKIGGKGFTSCLGHRNNLWGKYYANNVDSMVRLWSMTTMSGLCISGSKERRAASSLTFIGPPPHDCSLVKFLLIDMANAFAHRFELTKYYVSYLLTCVAVKMYI